MKNYRNAFFIALVGNLVLIGVLAGFWWWSHRPRWDATLPLLPRSTILRRKQ